MYPSVSTCATGNRTLDADDIAGVQALYPPATVPDGAHRRPHRAGVE